MISGLNFECGKSIDQRLEFSFGCVWIGPQDPYRHEILGNRGGLWVHVMGEWEKQHRVHCRPFFTILKPLHQALFPTQYILCAFLLVSPDISIPFAYQPNLRNLPKFCYKISSINYKYIIFKLTVISFFLHALISNSDRHLKLLFL